jgi:hypothetical protein
MQKTTVNCKVSKSQTSVKPCKKQRLTVKLVESNLCKAMQKTTVNCKVSKSQTSVKPCKKQVNCKVHL